MGLYDRDYVREEEGFRFGMGAAAQSVTTKLVIVNAVIFIIALLVPQLDVMSWLSASGESLIKPWLWWQLLTAGFAHDPLNINHVLFNMIGLWFAGQAVERVRGSKEFLCFYLAAIVLGNAVFALRHLLMDSPAHVLGASGGVVATVLLFICYFPNSTLLLFFVLPVKGWVAGIILIAANVYGAVQSSDGVAYDVHLVGAAFAFAYWRLHWSLARLGPWGVIDSLRSWLSRPRLKVHRPPRESPRLDAEADRVLVKLHEKGEASLTPQERRTLEEYSRRLRQRR
jgi:membrane associated rhomboid family serine protease